MILLNVILDINTEECFMYGSPTLHCGGRNVSKQRIQQKNATKEKKSLANILCRDFLKSRRFLKGPIVFKLFDNSTYFI